ncbi:MAG: CBS domain-containing protein [Psychrobium sp.]|nr:CBS domain-containing protein [Psychrobium sp.]
MTDITVKQLMHKNPTTIKCSTPLADVVKTLTNETTLGLIVVDDSNHVIGVVSEYDCHKALLAGSYHCDTPVSVNDIMTQSIINLVPNEHIADVAIKVLNETTDVYPVIENDNFIGTLTRGDILNVLIKNLNLCSKPSIYV